MNDKEYLAALQSLSERDVALAEEKAQLQKDYLDSQEFRVGDEVYYTPPSGWNNPSRELKGFIFNAEIISWLEVSVYYTVCPPTKAGKMPKVAKNARRGTKETLNLRKVEASND